MKKSELKKYISEALTPDEASKVEPKYKETYAAMIRGKGPLKLKKYDNPDKVVLGRVINNLKESTKRTNEKLDIAIKEVFSEKQRKYMCVMAQSGAKRPKGLSKADAKEMCADTKISKKVNEDNLDEEISNAAFQKHANRVEDLLRQLIGATKSVDSSQDDTEDDVEELDQSIDYLAAALTDKDPIDIAVDQATFGRLAKPTKEEINLEEIDAIMEKSAYEAGRKAKETGQEIAKKNMDDYKRLNELVKAALMGPISEKQASTDKYDDNPALKGKQSELPDGLQKAIIKKAGGKVDEIKERILRELRGDINEQDYKFQDANDERVKLLRPLLKSIALQSANAIEKMARSGKLKKINDQEGAIGNSDLSLALGVEVLAALQDKI